MKVTVLRCCLIAALCALLCACSGGGSTTTARKATSTVVPTVWTTLEQRPLHIPHLDPGATCPQAKLHPLVPSLGPGLGDGPAYPVMLSNDGTLQYAPPQNFGSSDWGGQKVLWAVDTPDYPDVVLVRGQQLDGSAQVRFETGPLPPTELRITPFAEGTPEHWTDQPSYTRVSGPGCYGYQIDGTTFSNVIVFEALPISK